ncbi:OadG family protein [Ruminococcaceae bacterium OttesenSCG-928-D13]|nr:OadG family protein [Ruminococcaceae bacterium OttesenSCG-928-D13]
MIIQALQIMLFGMLGIFIVMGLIILVIKLLDRLGRDKRDPGSSQS